MAKPPAAPKPDAPTADEAPTEQPTCGVVRPIADVDGYPVGHWAEVQQIIEEAAALAGFKARLVSDDEAIGVIMSRIVTNLHDDPIVVIDVSTLNPNVMFELGMRLTFEKPVVVIKDSLTTRYPFDASPIEYLPYSSDLRHVGITLFQERLAAAIRNTTEAASKPDNRSFLKHFGSFSPGTLGKDQSLDTRLILDEIATLRSNLRGSMAPPLWLVEGQERGSAVEQAVHARARASGRVRVVVPSTAVERGFKAASLAAIKGVTSATLVSNSPSHAIVELSHLNTVRSSEVYEAALDVLANFLPSS